MSDFGLPIVIDNGCGVCKVGFAGEPGPRSCFPAAVGRPRQRVQALLMPCNNQQLGREDVYVGLKAQARRGILTLSQPLEHSVVRNWDDMVHIWHHCFTNELGVSAANHPVLLTEAPLAPRQHREKLLEFMFENFQTPAIYLGLQAALALYASGRTTGLVLDMGEGASHAVPVHEGYPLHNAIQAINVAGCDLTEHMQRLLLERGHALSSSAEREIVRDIKESLCYLALDPAAEQKRAAANTELSRSYELPDGRQITLTTERFRCAEPLFQPSLLGKNGNSVPTGIQNSILKCDVREHKYMYGNLVLAGGTTMFPGMAQRLYKELSALVAPNINIKMIAPPERNHSVWFGGSILASLQTFEQMCVSKDEFNEYGSSIVHRKCI